MIFMKINQNSINFDGQIRIDRLDKLFPVVYRIELRRAVCCLSPQYSGCATEKRSCKLQ